MLTDYVLIRPTQIDYFTTTQCWNNKIESLVMITD